MHNVHRKKNILETRHDAQMCMCIMSCFNDIFAMLIFAVTVVSHTLLFNVRAPSWRAQLSHKRSNTTYFSCTFCLKWSTNSVQTHTHVSGESCDEHNLFDFDAQFPTWNVPNNMDAWLHGFQICVCCIRFSLLFRFSTCISKFYFSTLNVFRWTS